MSKRKTPAREARCSVRGWARSRGVAPSTALRAAKSGRLTRDVRGQVDPATADAEWAATMPLRIDAATAGTRARGAPRRKPETTARRIYLRARLRRERVRLREVRARYRALKERLVPTARVLHGWRVYEQAARAVLERWPARVGPSLAEVRDSAESVRLLDSSVRDLLTELAALDNDATLLAEADRDLS